MSHPLIEHSPDLQTLKEKGYALSIKNGHLVVEHVPFINEQGDVEYGALVSELTTQGNTTARPNGHVVSSTHIPRSAQGAPLSYLVLSETHNTATEHATVCELSNVPSGKEPDNYDEKISHYIDLIVPHAQSVDASITAQVTNPVDSSTDDVFHYIDSNTSRAGTGKYSELLAKQKIAIIGLGGTGSYILDQIAKTPVREIHLYDSDIFSNHNAFRSPGAASIDDLEAEMAKVEYATQQYSPMHRYIIPHTVRITEENVSELTANDFVFLCIDDDASRKIIAEHLIAQNIPFVDVGISLEVGVLGLVGVARVTSVYGERAHEALRQLPTQDIKDDVYASNIQMAEINMLNAAYAVIAWKQFCGFYYDTRSGSELVAHTDSGLNMIT